MTRWRGCLFLALSLGLAACGEAPPNVLLITIDTQRADRLGCYGNQVATPAMDRMAREGTLFEQASTTIPRTSQAIASLFTGQYPAEHGAREIGEYLSSEALTLAEVFAARGYQTAGVSANGLAGRFQGLHQGFDEFVDAIDLARAYPLWNELASPDGEWVGSAEAVTREALRILQGWTEKPWFLWVHYSDPHFPYSPPPPEVTASQAREFYEDMPSFEPRASTIFFDLNGRASALRPVLSRMYDREVVYTDKWIGTLMAQVRSVPGADRMVMALTSDHGESLGEHGYFYEHGDFVYEATMRIPFVFHAPGRVAAGGRIGEVASIIDLPATLLGLAGVEVPSTMSGWDWSKRLGRESPASGEAPRGLEGRVVFGESGSALRPQNPRRIHGGRRRGEGPTQRPFRSVRRGQWVLLRNEGSARVSLYDTAADPALKNDRADEQVSLARELETRLAPDVLDGRWRMARDDRWKLVRAPVEQGDQWSLFDLESDPGEENDVSQDHPAELSRLRSALEGWMAGDQTDVPVSPSRGDAVEAEVERQLRSLGYID